MEEDYTLSEEKISLFTETFLLLHMKETQHSFDVLLDNANQCLDGPLHKLLTKGLIEIDKSHHYVLSTPGEKKAIDFKERYSAHLAYFDIFSHVDIAAGEFALPQQKNYPNARTWYSFLAEDRWEDLRVATLDYLDADPLEFIFAQFVIEKRIDTTKAGWQLELVHGQFWQDIVSLANSNLDCDDLTFTDEQTGATTLGTDLLETIIEHAFTQLEDLRPGDNELSIFWKNWEQEEVSSQYATSSVTKNIWMTPWTLN